MRTWLDGSPNRMDLEASHAAEVYNPLGHARLPQLLQRLHLALDHHSETHGRRGSSHNMSQYVAHIWSTSHIYNVQACGQITTIIRDPKTP